MYATRGTNFDRAKAAVPAAAVHVLVALLLMRGLGAPPPAAPGEELKLIELTESIPEPDSPKRPEPSPGETRSEQKADPRAEGAASPPNLASRATELVAPEPVIVLPVPPPIIAAPIPSTGVEASSGNAQVPGLGTGSGGIGDGTGSGARGGGAGGGGAGGAGDGRGYSPPRLLRGRIRDSDYPRELGEQGIGGVVGIRYTVEPDGRATDCKITRTSGSALLDAVTCRLIEQRFRFDPSRDRAGRPVRSQMENNHEWVVEDFPPEPEERSRPRRRIW
jgi:periplasmic protein TonB